MNAKATVLKGLVYYDYVGEKHIGVTLYKVEGSPLLWFSFTKAPQMVKDLNAQYGVQINNCFSYNVFCQMMEKLGCVFEKRLPITSRDNMMESYRILNTYIMGLELR